MASEQKCRCGYDVTHPLIETNEHYGAAGWLLLAFGGTPVPASIDYRCTRCKEVLESTTDPRALRDFHQGGKR